MMTTPTPTQAPAEPHLVPANEVARRTGRHPVTVRRDMRLGQLPGVKVGGRWFMASATLDRLLAGELPDR